MPLSTGALVAFALVGVAYLPTVGHRRHRGRLGRLIARWRRALAA